MITKKWSPLSTSGLPYGNITVKQEVGVPTGMGMPSQRSQLSSPDAQNMGALSNPFSVGKNVSVSKHICAVCGDRASGKHYGVYSCEGCKGIYVLCFISNIIPWFSSSKFYTIKQKHLLRSQKRFQCNSRTYSLQCSTSCTYDSNRYSFID